MPLLQIPRGIYHSCFMELSQCPRCLGSGFMIFKKCPSSFPSMVELVSFLFNRLDDDFFEFNGGCLS
jgi:hypothetical protein